MTFFYLVMWVVSVFVSTARAGNVRTIYLDQSRMAPIHLKLGQSTVLRFSEKPKKVVIGNQNFFSVEFIDFDVTLQPSSHTVSNLFVYGEHHTYGFLLQVGGNPAYDDLVTVKWKNTIVPAAMGRSHPPPATPAKVSMPKLSTNIGKTIKISVEKILGPTTLGVHVVDLKIENILKSDLPLKDFSVRFFSGQEEGSGEPQNFVLDREIVRPHEQAASRLIFKLKSKENARLQIQFGKDIVIIKLPEKSL